MRSSRLLILIASLTLFLIPYFSLQAEATCTWRESYSYFDSTTETYIKVGGCNNNEEIGNNCQGKSPSGNHICCCEGTTSPAAITTPPKFKIPQLQVPSLGAKELSEVTCIVDDEGNYSCPVPWIGQYITAIYNYGVGIAGILAAIVLMAGGVLWLISGGDSSKITQAKELIGGSITGLIILMTSYVILIEINPALVGFKPISLSYLKEAEVKLATQRYGGEAQSYKSATCANATELANGVNFYATGYYKPQWENTEKFWCVVGMQCSCPNGRDTNKDCDFLYGKTFPGYHPCNYFPSTTAYCNMTASGQAPKIGDIAGPGNCKDTLPFGTKVCFKGKTYTITDTGGGIQGRRIDIWSGNSLEDAKSNTGIGTLKKGACP